MSKKKQKIEYYTPKFLELPPEEQLDVILTLTTELGQTEAYRQICRKIISELSDLKNSFTSNE